MELWHLLGQRMGVGFTGTTVSEQLRRLVQTYKIGNVILFRANLESADQARALCEDLQDLIQNETGFPAFIAIDQEGGMVSRLPGDMVVTPGAMALAATGDPGAAYEAAALTAGELLDIGVNVNLAPVLDINSNPQNPVIGVRSFGETPDTVEAFAGEMIRAFEERGILCAGKHFPGHGDTHLDSHIALPSVDKSREALEQNELRPFQAAVRAGIPAIMSSHILFPALDPSGLPATMSRRILTDLLKGEMGFSGLVVSDGMEMGAIREHFGTPQGCVLALGAGVDIAFVCHDPALMEESMLALAQAHEHGELDPAENRASVMKILTEKAAYRRRFEASQAALEPEDRAARKARNQALMRRTISLCSPSRAIPSLGANPLCIGPLAYRSTIASTAPDTALCFGDWFAGRLGGTGRNVGAQPTAEEQSEGIKALCGSTGLLLGTYNAHLNPAQQGLASTLIQAAKQRGLPVVAVALRNPYDLRDMDPYAHRIAAYEYSENSFAAVLGALKGEYLPQGRLPFDL